MTYYDQKVISPEIRLGYYDRGILDAALDKYMVYAYSTYLGVEILPFNTISTTDKSCLAGRLVASNTVYGRLSTFVLDDELKSTKQEKRVFSMDNQKIHL